MSNGVPVGAPFGLQLPVWDIRITNRSGSDRSKGQILKLDLDMGSEATDNQPGHALSGLSNGEAPIAGAQCGVQICVVLLEDVADDATGNARVYGRVDAMSGGALTYTDGSGESRALTVDTDYTLHPTAAANNQGVYAIGIGDTGASLADGLLSTVLWNGFTWGTMGT